MHWAPKWVGKSYPHNGCWLFLCDVYAAEFALDLPNFDEFRDPPRAGVRKIQEELSKSEWVECEPHDGCGVALTQKNLITHVGVYADIDGGRVLHTINGQVAAVSAAWLRKNHWKATYYKCHRFSNA